MPQFHYTAKRGPHQTVQGTIEAEHLDEAITKISQLGYIPLDVHSPQARRRPSANKSVKSLLNLQSHVSPFGLTLFTRQVSDLLDAGVPILQLLRTIAKQTQQPLLKNIIEGIFAFVKDGGAFSKALAQHPDIFPRLYVEMVHAGELSGRLDVLMRRLADFMERDLETRSQVKSSLIYPSVILGVAGVTIFALLTFVIPRVTFLLEDMDQGLPWPTVFIMGLSDFCRGFWWLIAAVVIGIFLYWRQLKQTPKGKIWLDKAQLKIPLFGEFIHVAEIGRFSRSLATLLEGGVMVVPALEASCGIMNNETIREGIKQLAQEVANGSSLTQALKNHAVFPEEAVSMVAVGEESGQLYRGLNKLADYYDRQSNRFIKRMTSLIEPVLILFVGLVVGFIFIGMLLPILRMNLMIK